MAVFSNLKSHDSLCLAQFLFSIYFIACFLIVFNILSLSGSFVVLLSEVFQVSCLCSITTAAVSVLLQYLQCSSHLPAVEIAMAMGFSGQYKQ